MKILPKIKKKGIELRVESVCIYSPDNHDCQDDKHRKLKVK